jgi:hypothetical protein
VKPSPQSLAALHGSRYFGVHMLTVLGSQLLTPQPQSGVFGAHAQFVVTQAAVNEWQTMPGAHSASTLQCASVHPISCVVTHGSAGGHEAPGAQALGAQPDSATTVHSKPTLQAGPVPHPGGGARIALDSELNRNTAEAAKVAGKKRI